MKRREGPSIRCRVVERLGSVTREALVTYDGSRRWVISDAEKTHLNDGERCIVMHPNGVVERIPVGAHIHGWVKVLITPRKMAHLDGAGGRVVGREEVQGRACWVVEAEGLKSGSDQTYRMWVDAEGAFVMRTVLLGLDGDQHLEDVVVGEEFPPGIFTYVGDVDRDETSWAGP